MRIFLAGTILFALAALGFAGPLPPMTPKDISLMLRSGYSSEAVEREVAARHFTGTLDATGEKNLAQAGASPTLVNGLKSGAFAVPASQQASVQAEMAAKAQSRARQVEESRKLDTLYQARLAQARNAPPAEAATKATAIASLVKGDLMTSRNGVLGPFRDAEFEKKKLIGLYFSAHWCPPCRKFTPNLVAYYNKNAAAHPEFEILFVSFDKSAAAMESYMRELQMPWPAVVFDTYAGKNYRGPEAVLNDLDQFFAGKSSGQVAQAR